jgi:hypothetical protein
VAYSQEQTVRVGLADGSNRRGVNKGAMTM